jgi:hypothetical protein
MPGPVKVTLGRRPTNKNDERHDQGDRKLDKLRPADPEAPRLNKSFTFFRSRYKNEIASNAFEGNAEAVGDTPTSTEDSDCELEEDPDIEAASFKLLREMRNKFDPGIMTLDVDDEQDIEIVEWIATQTHVQGTSLRQRIDELREVSDSSEKALREALCNLFREMEKALKSGRDHDGTQSSFVLMEGKTLQWANLATHRPEEGEEKHKLDIAVRGSSLTRDAEVTHWAQVVAVGLIKHKANQDFKDSLLVQTYRYMVGKQDKQNVPASGH